MNVSSRPGRAFMHRAWTVVAHLVDDVEPDRICTIAPVGADGSRVRPFSQS